MWGFKHRDKLSDPSPLSRVKLSYCSALSTETSYPTPAFYPQR
jgi:hypothetical protein